MAVYDNMNYSYDAGIAPTLLEAYLQRKALKNVEPNLGYLRDAQMIEQPKNNGKHVRFFRYTELPAVTKPLYEGVTPDGQKLQETTFSVMTKQYGAHMEYTDELDLFHVDKKTDAMSDRLNRQAALSIDTVGRDQICAGLNVMYPGTVTSRAALTSSNILTYRIYNIDWRLDAPVLPPFERMQELKASGITIVLVTHDGNTVKSFCNRAIWINEGEIASEGNPKAYIRRQKE